MNKIIYFIKYHNAVPIILGIILLGTAGAFAQEDVRNTVLGQKVESVQGIDNSQILSADLDNFDLGLKIENVTQDEKNYYVNYAYKTLAIKDNAWQEVLQQKTLTVDVKSIEGKDLGIYVQDELAEVADWELNFLKRVQTDEKKNGLTRLTASVDYTGLIGLVLDAKDKILPGYKPVVTEEICDGLDNNKDGQIDEGFRIGEICTVGTGACQRQGVYVCSSDGKSVCSVNPGEPDPEICDGVDNNCNGQIDEGGVCAPAPEPPQPENLLPEIILPPAQEEPSSTESSATSSAVAPEESPVESPSPETILP